MKLNSIQLRFLLSFITISASFLILNYLQYQQLIEGGTSALASFMAAATVFSLTLGAVLFILGSTISAPIKKLSNAAKNVSSGNLQIRADVKTDDEIEEIAESLNKITVDLKRSGEKVEKLENYSKDMDKVVYSKTDELNKKIEDLTRMKTAILNMMEDADDTNVKLLVSQEKLKKSLGELKELDTRKDQFISVAAHELKTPITVIRGFSDLLQGEKLASDVAARNKYLGIINVEIKRLGKLVDDILDLSRIDVGKIRLTIDKADIYEIVERVKSMTSPLVRSKNLDFIFDVDENLPEIMTDKERLEQIFINLINNSVKFTDRGSITLGIHKEGQNIHISVKDTGVGIPEKDMEKIGERFFQVESHLTRKAGGAGLGISICREILKLMNGKLWIESSVGKGSTFHVQIPIKQPE